MTLDVCLQADIFNAFRNIIWDKFEIDCSKYITSCSFKFRFNVETYCSEDTII